MDALPVPLTRLHGALTIVAGPSQHEALTAAVEACGPALVLDLAAVDAFDSAGVQLLLSARRSLAARGATLRLASVSSAVADVLALYGLQAVLPGSAGAEVRP